MNEVDQLNSFLITEYEPEVMMIEAPKRNVFEQIEDSNVVTTKTEKDIVNKYIKSSSEKEKTTTSSSYSSSYYNRGYSYGSSSSTKKSPSDEMKDKFNDIRKKAYEDAEREIKSKKTSSKYSKNPQLKSLRKSWLPSISRSAKPTLKGNGSRKKKLKTAGLVISIVLIQTTAMILKETRESLAREKDK